MDSPDSTTAAATPVSRPVAMRLYAIAVMLAGAALLGLAGWMTPDPSGVGTHRQLGFGQCGMLITTGLPCPTCGMTTAFAWTVRGRLAEAFVAQPTGLLLALATVATTLGAGWVAVAGRYPPLRFPVMTPYRVFFGLLILLLGGWGFKIVIGLLNGTLPYRP